MRLQNRGTFENIKISYQNSQLKKSFDLMRKENQKRATINPDLQRIWDDNKRSREKMKAESIARKIAKGSQVTAEERAFLEKNNPELLKKAEEAKKAADELKNRLKSAKTKEEAKDIIIQANGMVVEVGKRDIEFAGLLKEGHDSVIKEYTESSKYKNLPDRSESKKKREDEECSSVDYYC